MTRLIQPWQGPVNRENSCPSGPLSLLGSAHPHHRQRIVIAAQCPPQKRLCSAAQQAPFACRRPSHPAGAPPRSHGAASVPRCLRRSARTCRCPLFQSDPRQVLGIRYGFEGFTSHGTKPVPLTTASMGTLHLSGGCDSERRKRSRCGTDSQGVRSKTTSPLRRRRRPRPARRCLARRLGRFALVRCRVSLRTDPPSKCHPSAPRPQKRCCLIPTEPPLILVGPLPTAPPCQTMGRGSQPPHTPVMMLSQSPLCPTRACSPTNPHSMRRRGVLPGQQLLPHLFRRGHDAPQDANCRAEAGGLGHQHAVRHRWAGHAGGWVGGTRRRGSA
jgi:hypothetical protein